MNRCDELARFRALARAQHLVVWQYLLRDMGQHAPGSLHSQPCAPGARSARAFDAFAPMTVLGKLRMARYARYMRRHHKHELTEGIYNGRWTKLSVKNGYDVPTSYWGTATWSHHNNHVHIGI